MKTKNELIDNLAKIIGLYSDDKEVIQKIQEVYVQKKMTIRTVGFLFKGFTPLENLSKVELGVWCVYLYDITKEKIINPLDYFTENEIYEIRQYCERNPFEMRTDKIVLHNVSKVIDNGKEEYRCNDLSNYDLYKITLNNLLTYNFRTQREAKITKYKNKIITQANINRESTEKIRDLIVAGRFSANLLTFNIRRPAFCNEGVIFKEYVEGVNFGDLEITPNIEKGIFCDIIDGQHRINGNAKAVEVANETGIILEGGFIVKIAQFTEDEAQEYIFIQNEQNKMSEEHSKSYAKDDINVFIETLNRYGKPSINVMHNKICNTLNEVENYNRYTTINILNNAFRLSGLKFNDPFRNEIYLNSFIEIFNTILGYYSYKYKNKKELRENTIVYNPNTFVAYVAIGKELLEKENKKQILLKLLQENKIDLSKDAYDWREIDIYRENLKSYKKIYDYFKKIIKEEIK